MLNPIWNVVSSFINELNKNLSKYSPTTLIAGTIAATLVLQKAFKFYKQWDTKLIKKSLMNKSIQYATHLPYYGPLIQTKINKGVNGILASVKTDVDHSRARWEPIAIMPEEGFSAKKIKERFTKLEANYHVGKLSGAVYAQYDKKLANLLQFVWSKTALTNPMHQSEWPLINLMEAEVISMCQELMHGEFGAPGIMTHGGSTSILEACKAYVLHARENGIAEPEIIVPSSRHPAFDKAALQLNAKLMIVPVDKNTGAADVKAMEKAITTSTCMLVGSAPSFAFGIIDPIEELGKIALKNKIPLHVDSCLGGFVTAFAQKAGFDIPACDFSVPGVQSISIDTHKYGQTPKGTSVLLLSPTCNASPTYTNLEWMGGMYVTPGIDGSRSGADIAVAWTVLCHKGKQTYVKETKEILDLQQLLVNELKSIDGIFIPYPPELSVIPIEGKNINSSLMADRFKKAGWGINILQTDNQEVCGFHFCLTSVHVQQKDFVKLFIKDLAQAVDYAKNHPNEKPAGIAGAYGKLAEGVPHFVQDRIGKGYINILNTLPLRSAPSMWASTAPKKIAQDISHHPGLKIK